MKTLTVNLPDAVDLDTLQLTRFLAATLYEKGELTLGQAAEMSGMAKWEFPKVLEGYGIPLFNYPPEEFDEDERNLHQYIKNGNPGPG